MAQSRRQAHFTQVSFTCESKITNGRDRPPLNLFGHSNKAAVTGVRANLHRAVVKNYIGKRDTVVLVDPVCVQRNITIKRVSVIFHALRAMLVVIPTVKNGVQSVGLWQFLQGMASDKGTLHVVNLVSQHVISNCTALFNQERICIHCAKAIIPITTKVAQIVARCIQFLSHLIKHHIRIILHIQRN